VRGRNHWHVYEQYEENVREIESSVGGGRGVRYDSEVFLLRHFSLHPKKSGRMNAFVVKPSQWKQETDELQKTATLIFATALSSFESNQALFTP
jgi:hypothetical protein